VSTSGGHKTTIWANFDFWGLLYRLSFTDEGQIWCAIADPRYTLTCQILSRSVYSVALCWRKAPIFAVFWTSAFSVVANWHKQSDKFEHGCTTADLPLSGVGVRVAGSVIQFTDAVKLLGVTLDFTVTFDQHTTNVVRACTYTTCAHCVTSDHCSPPTPRRRSPLPSLVPGWTIVTAYYMVPHLEIWTDCKKFRINWHVLFCSCFGRRVRRTHDANCTGCRSHNELSSK